MSIEAALKAFGTAQVLVSLKEARGSSSALSASVTKLIQSAIGDCFTLAAGSRLLAVAAAAGLSRPRRGLRIYRNLGLALGTVDHAGFVKLKRHKAVDSVHEAPDLSLIRPVGSATAAAAVSAGPTWGIRRMKVDKVWEEGFRGKGVLIAHLDTGVDGTHPGLKPAIQMFEEFDDTGEFVPGAVPHDSGSHGTHTAGTIAGRPVGGTEFGVAPEAMLACGLVIEGGDVVRRILAGMDWAVGANVKVLSMSLGLRGFNESFLPLMQSIRNRGILPVIAVGNEGPATSRSPGNYDEVLSVGACNRQDEVADFSSSQQLLQPEPRWAPDLVAPGVDVLSAKVGGGLRLDSGSSMATPHIAGLAALLWQAKPNATVDEIENAIFQSCQRPATMTVDRGHRGLPDALQALTLLGSGTATVAASTDIKRPSKKAVAKATKKAVAKKKAKSRKPT